MLNTMVAFESNSCMPLGQCTSTRTGREGDNKLMYANERLLETYQARNTKGDISQECKMSEFVLQG